MNRDIIERLAMDRAAGQLSEDACALFEAYLGEHPEQELWARQMHDTYAATERTFRDKASPPQSRAFRARPDTPIRSTARPPAMLRWAAVIAVAFLFGAGAGRLSRQPQLKTEFVSGSERSPYRTGLISEPSDGFWGKKVVAITQGTSRKLRSQGPRAGLWQRRAQFNKESNHE